MSTNLFVARVIQMLPKYLVEFMGSLTLSMTALHTRVDPIVMGIALTLVLLIGRGITTGYYSPLTVGLQWLLGRQPWTEAIANVSAQLAGMVGAYMTYQDLHVLLAA